MKNPYEILRQKETELARLQREVEALRIAIKLLAEETDFKAAQKTGELTQAEMIMAILEEADHPMHISDIAIALDKKYSKKYPPPHLTSTIYRYMKQKKFFRKEKKPATFGLVEWPAYTEVLEVNGIKVRDRDLRGQVEGRNE